MLWEGVSLEYVVIYHYIVYMCDILWIFLCSYAECFFMSHVHIFLSVCVLNLLPVLVIVYSILYLCGFNAFRSLCTWCHVHACVLFSESLWTWSECMCISTLKRVTSEKQGVMSDARGGFLPTSSLACWLTNGLLSGLADRLAGPQWLSLPYLVVKAGGWWCQGKGWGSGGTLFTCRVRRLARQSAMEKTQIT